MDRRVITLKYTSDEPGTLYLDGKAYALGTGRVFVLADAGEPFQTARSMALRSNEDLVKIGDIAMDDMKRARPAATPAPKSAKVPAKTEGNMVKVPDDQYVKSGLPVAEVKDVVWNDPQNGLSLGCITGDEWRILGKEVKVELWVRNPGDKDVKFQLNMRPDIGVLMKLKSEKGEEHESNIVPTDVPPFGEHRLLPPGHALKVKEFTVSLLWLENDVSGIKGHYFAIEPGAYHFHCELELPGFSATGESGKQLTPAEGEWTGKLTTRRLNVTVITPDAPAPKSAAMKRKHEYAQSLFTSWTTAARADGNIPGALIGRLGKSVKTFIKNNPTSETTPQLQKMLPRLDASRDWSGQDAVGLLDELAALQSTPISMALDDENQSVIRTGTPLPPEPENAPWGDAVSFDPPAYPHPDGLRVAWLLEPRAAEHRLGTPLKARVLIHNSGNIPVVFRTRSWHQLSQKATDAKGADIRTESTRWTTRGLFLWYRLHNRPGLHAWLGSMTSAPTKFRVLPADIREALLAALVGPEASKQKGGSPQARRVHAGSRSSED